MVQANARFKGVLTAFEFVDTKFNIWKRPTLIFLTIRFSLVLCNIVVSILLFVGCSRFFLSNHHTLHPSHWESSWDHELSVSLDPRQISQFAFLHFFLRKFNIMILIKYPLLYFFTLQWVNVNAEYIPKRRSHICASFFLSFSQILTDGMPQLIGLDISPKIPVADVSSPPK